MNAKIAIPKINSVLIGALGYDYATIAEQNCKSDVFVVKGWDEEREPPDSLEKAVATPGVIGGSDA